MSQHDPLAEKIVSAIKHDLHSGATELARDALVLLARYADSLSTVSPIECKDSLVSLGEQLRHLRPSMAPMQNILSEWQMRLDALQANNTKNLSTQVQALCAQLINDINTRQDKLVGHAVKGLASAKTIMTISRSSTLCEVFKKLTQRPLGFIICESRPGCEGKKLAAELASADIRIEYIIDAAIGNHIKQADAVVVGADTILADGSVVNKCGTCLLALAAQFWNIPFYVIADTSKYSGLARDELTLEELPIIELAAPDSPSIYPRNIYFDVTDNELIGTYITEHGIQKRWPR
jgi:translation initiation factor eIF-2B subunit delta